MIYLRPTIKSTMMSHHTSTKTVSDHEVPLNIQEQLVFPYDVIIAHGPGCNDGATAAWSVWRTLPRSYRDMLAKEGGFYDKPRNDENIETSPEFKESFLHPNSPEGAIRLQERGFPVVFVFRQPSESVPSKLVENKRVMILDLDMGDALIEVVSASSYTFLCDHHDSTPLTLNKHSDFLFNQSRHKFSLIVNTNKTHCGATLAWTLTHEAEIPPFVQIVRIGDTWQWHDYPKLNARFVLKSLYMRRAFRSFVDIECTFIHWDKNFAEYVSQGRKLLEYETAITKQIAKHCDIGYVQTNDGIIYTVAYTQANVLHSEVGSMMKWYAQKRFKIPIHFCVTWKYISYKGIVSVSLRDAEPGINLSSIARNIKSSDGKGGGHADAAGFTFSGIENLHNFILKESPMNTYLQSNQPILLSESPTVTKL